MRLLGEQAVETAVERHARDHRDQDGRRGGNHREQSDDAHVQAGGRSAPPPGLNHPPHLAPDQPDEKRDRDRIDEKESDDDLMGRCDRREAGEHHEGGEGRQERENDRKYANRTRNPRRTRRGRTGHELGLADLRH